MAMTRIDIIMQAINALVPKAEYVMRGDFSGLEWLDSRTAPTESAVQAKYDELIAAEPTNLLREKRNRLLAETDWWASSDLTMTTEQTNYRQALRDITETYSNLDEVVWPTKP
tara:strand:+ start:295 stop:633 length:339 start_codon:yes stop_codon:yes gene_type:complete